MDMMNPGTFTTSDPNHARLCGLLFGTSHAELARWVACMEKHQRQTIADQLYGLAQVAIWDASYAEARCAMGADQGHDKAEAKANKRLTALRKAIGFSYPGSAELHIPPPEFRVRSSHGSILVDDAGNVTGYSEDADDELRKVIRLDLPDPPSPDMDILFCGEHHRDGSHVPPTLPEGDDTQ